LLADGATSVKNIVFTSRDDGLAYWARWFVLPSFHNTQIVEGAFSTEAFLHHHGENAETQDDIQQIKENIINKAYVDVLAVGEARNVVKKHLDGSPGPLPKFFAHIPNMFFTKSEFQRMGSIVRSRMDKQQQQCLDTKTQRTYVMAIKGIIEETSRMSRRPKSKQDRTSHAQTLVVCRPDPIRSLKVADIRKLLKEHGLNVDGTKSVLRERLKSYEDSNPSSTQTTSSPSMSSSSQRTTPASYLDEIWVAPTIMSPQSAALASRTD